MLFTYRAGACGCERLGKSCGVWARPDQRSDQPGVISLYDPRRFDGTPVTSSQSETHGPLSCQSPLLTMSLEVADLVCVFQNLRRLWRRPFEVTHQDTSSGSSSLSLRYLPHNGMSERKLEGGRGEGGASKQADE